MYNLYVLYRRLGSLHNVRAVELDQLPFSIGVMMSKVGIEEEG